MFQLFQRGLALLAALVCLTALPLVWVHSQEQKPPQNPADQTVVRIETELVQIDVVVVEKDGKLVRDLRREDFELYEDGKKQPVSHFAVGTAAKPARWLSVEKKKPGAEPAASAAPAEVTAGRYIVLAVDDYHIAPENLMIAKRTLLKFINEQMVAGDQVAVVTTSGNIGMFQQFTNERGVLERAVTRLNPQTRTVTSSFDVPRIGDYQAELIDRNDPDALEVAIQEILRLEPPPPPTPGRGGGRSAPNPDGGMSPRDRAMLQARNKARTIVAQNANYTRVTLSTLESVIRSLNGLPGRKMMVLVSDGFFLGGNSSSQIFDLRRITDAATRAGVVIYSIDARGLVATPPGGDASDPGVVDPTMAGARARMDLGAVDAKRDGMYALAIDTGGKAFFNNNDLSAGLQRVLDDNEVYYVLAYEPPASRRDGRFHQIEVRIADRPELKVRTRKGYLASLPPEAKAEKAEKEKAKPKSPEKIAQEAKATKDKEIRRGLGSLFPLRDIALDLAADFVNFPDSGSSAMLNAQIVTAGLSFQPADNGITRAQLDLTIVLFDEQGKVAASLGDTLSVNLKQSAFEQMVHNDISYRKVLPLKPGFYQARVAVREEGTARLGSAARWLEIPDLAKKQLTLSSILLMPSYLKQTAAQNGDQGEVGYQMQFTSASRKFKRDTSFDFLVFAYNARSNKVAPDLVIQSQVFSGSKLVFATPVAKMITQELPDPQRIPYAARITLDGFTPGEYELRMVVVDRSTKITANRRVNFTVE
jgi:VWFA-related protein